MTETKKTERPDPRILQVAQALSTAVRIAGRSRLSLERQMELSSGYLSKILGGTVELRMRHVFMILDALEVDPADFFRAAFPRRNGSSRDEAGQRLENFELPPMQEPASFTSAEIDEQVKRSIARLLGFYSGKD